MRKLINICLIIILLSLNYSFGQNIEFKASNFRDKKDELKTAEANLVSGDAYFKEGLKTLEEGNGNPTAFASAIPPYLKANAFNPDNAELNYKIGKAHFYSGKMSESVPYLEKALRLNEKDCEPDAFYLLGKALKLENRFDEAKGQFNLYKSKEKDKILSKISEEVNREIMQCDQDKLMISKPLERIWIEAVKDWNSEYDDYAPSITADESMVVFNSSKPMAGGSENPVSVWISSREKGRWSPPRLFGAPFDPLGQYEALSVSFDGQALYLGKLGVNEDIYLSRLQGKSWAPPLRLPDKVNSETPETGACFSTDGIKIYYVTQMPYGNKGGKDLYFSGIMDRKQNLWGEGMTIGSEVNTTLNDGYIYLHPDGKTLYFASQGHNSMGGYDIFKSTRLAGRWSQPENLGYPINTPYDETSFVLSASGKRAYITSNRKEGNKGGMDIYRVTYLGPVKQPLPDFEDQLLADVAAPQREDRLEGKVDVESKNLTILKGRVIDDFTRQPIGADIEIVDNLKNEVIATFTSNSATGKFLVSLPAGFNYGIAVKAKDYLFHSENFNLPETSNYQMVDKEIRLKGVCIGCKIILRNIFFDTGKFALRPESTMELNRLADLIRDIARVKPGIRIEISGHTDNVGSESSNLILSENRAKAVVKYLVDHGISQEKLVYKGYGPNQPVAPNLTADGRQENRRTEFKIIGE
jgi:outer membrane protein OmpA-like peptidoglycan-associated protein/tetratricopeptide (TPR) repeat protein